MLTLDHLTVIAPSLAEGVAHVRACLDIDIPFGGTHPDMATHNHLLRLSDDCFLEVIAIDPAAPAPGRPRWFGLDDAQAVQSAWDDGSRLRGWVARTGDLDAVLARHDWLGAKTRLSRGDRSWLFSLRPDGALPADGVAPAVMDWGDRGTPTPAMPDLGARLTSFGIEHPDPAHVTALYERLGVVNPPRVAIGPRLRYRAIIDTPGGVKQLF
ncbi:MAG: VOC family protein [Pseudomonadota bacterium]